MDLTSDIAKDLISRGADVKFLESFVMPEVPEGVKLGFVIVSPQEYRGCCKKVVEALIPIIEQHMKNKI